MGYLKLGSFDQNPLNYLKLIGFRTLYRGADATGESSLAATVYALKIKDGSGTIWRVPLYQLATDDTPASTYKEYFVDPDDTGYSGPFYEFSGFNLLKFASASIVNTNSGTPGTTTHAFTIRNGANNNYRIPAYTDSAGAWVDSDGLGPQTWTDITSTRWCFGIKDSSGNVFVIPTYFIPTESDVSDLLLYLHDGTNAILAITNTFGDWEYLANSPGGLVAKSGQLMRFSSNKFGLRKAATAIIPPFVATETTGKLTVSTDGGATWTNASLPISTFYEPDEEHPNFNFAISDNGTDIYSVQSDGDDTNSDATVFKSSDNGATWSVYYLNYFQESAAIGSNLAVKGGEVFYCGVGNRSTNGNNEFPHSFSIEYGDGTNHYSKYTGTLSVPPEDHVSIPSWCNSGRRIVIAIHEARYELNELRSIILYIDPATSLTQPEINNGYTSGFVWRFDEAVYQYDPGIDRGRSIGLIWKTGTNIMFAGWEDGTVLRSSDNGSSWATMSQVDNFVSAQAMAYDNVKDILWAIGKNGSGVTYIQKWTTASITSDPSSDATGNLNVFGTLSTPRTAGYLGLVVKNYFISSSVMRSSSMSIANMNTTSLRTAASRGNYQRR